MKKILIFLFVVIVATILGGCSETSPVTYNDELIDLSNSLNEEYFEYVKYAEETRLEYTDKIEERRQETVATVNMYLSEIKEKGSFRGDRVFLNAVISDGESVLSLLKNEHKELVTLRNEILNNEDITDIKAQEYLSQQESIETKITETWEQDIKNIEVAQSSFAEKYGYEIEN